MSEPTDQNDAEPPPDETEQTDEADEGWSITGDTTPPEGRRLVAVVWLDAAAGRTVLGSDPVGSDGSFEVSFGSDELVPGVARFVLAIIDEDTGRVGAERSVPSDPRETALADPVEAPAPLQGYAALRVALRRALIERRDIAEDADDDEVDRVLGRAAPETVTDLADRMDVAPATVDALRTTARTLPIGLAPAVGFVLVSAGLDLDVDALVADQDRVATAVELAVSRGEVDVAQIGAEGTEIGSHVVRLLAELAELDDLGRPAVSGGIPIIQLIELALGEVQRADLLAFAGLHADHDMLDDGFWTALDDARWRTAGDRSALRHVFWLDELTLSSSPLVEHLAAADPALTLESALALSVTEWEDHVQAASTSDSSAVPDRFRTGSVQAQREAYALQIAARLRRTHPDRAGRLLVERVTTAAASRDDGNNPLAALAALLAADPNFDVVRGELVDDPQARRERVLLQRVLAGDDRDPVAATFVYAAETVLPVQAVARMGQRAFAAREGSAETYLYAAFANAAVVTIYSDLRAASSAPRAEERVELTDWSKEFGEIDDTACEHCSSVYSPAAYLVDILRFVIDRGLGDHLLDAARRPDLEVIRLDCANTETPLPYIDLVNEILESAVLAAANDAIVRDDPAATDLFEMPPVGQTTIDDLDELRAHPEHLAADAYDVVAEAVHPFSVPFDLWHAEARAYLALAGVDRSEVRRVVRPGADTAPDDLGLFTADVAILDGSATVHPNYQAPSYARDVDKLRRATGLGFDELADVLSTDYVVGNGDALTLNLDTEPETIEEGLGIDHARRIHRLLLLRHRLGLDLEQLDRALGVVGGIDSRGRVGTGALADLAVLRRLTAALPLRFEEVALLFSDTVSTRRRANGRSDFDDWFARPTATDPGASSVFELDASGTDLAVTDALVAENDSELRAALGVTPTDFAALREIVDEHITLRSLADLVRWTLLARALRSDIPQLISLVRVSEVEPFVRSSADPAKFLMDRTEEFVHIVRRLGATGASVGDVTDLLLHPQTVDRTGSEPSDALGLVTAVRAAIAAADDDADRDEVALAAVSAALDLDRVATARLLDRVQPPTGDGRTTREVLLDTVSAVPDRAQTLTADRLHLAARLVHTLALPADAVGLLFEPDTGWLDPHQLLLATSDPTTETDRPEVLVSGAAVVRADADGTATIPLVVEVDGTPFTGVIEWRSVGGCAASVTRSRDAWQADVAGTGDVTIIATIDERAPGRAPGTGAITVNVRAHDDWPRRVEDRPDRVEDDLIALYDFHEGGGSTISDVSRRGEPLDLQLSGGGSWLAGGGLVVDGTARVRSIEPATKINEAVASSGEITVEAWISPADTQQAGPARIVTISADAFHRNVTLGQNASGVVGRFRTSSTGENGTLPATSVGRGLDPAPDGSALHHVVYTRRADGGRLYIDGEEVAHERRVTGSTDGWTRDMHLALAGELGDAADADARRWRGTYHLVAIYDVALSPSDIARHHALGPAPALPSPEVGAPASHVAMLPWDVPTLTLEMRGTVAAQVPETVSIDWTTVSGPVPVSFADAAALETSASFSVTGDYVLGLRATDRRDPNAWAAATLAVRIAADPAGATGRWARFAHALEFSGAAYASAVAVAGPSSTDDHPPGLFDLLARANEESAQTPLGRSFIDDLGTVTGVGAGVEALIQAVIGDPESRRRRTFGECQDGTALVRVARAASVALRSGTAPRSLVAWAADRIDRQIAADIRVAIRSTFERDRWLDAATEVRDELRERQRDALVAYLLVRTEGFDEPDDIYGHFLIDVQMSSCQLTSRLKQAISSVQQFIQRTLLGIEQGALEPEDAEQWRWMKSYRVWEANRKIFLHPENWLEPELRAGKSPFFEELEADLAQVELTEAAATRAVSSYLEKLHAVANLEIVGLCHEHDGRAKTEPSVLHVIGRTRGQPRHYWHRTLVGGIDWTPWRAVDSDLMGDHIVPVFHNGRLSVFSAEFEAKEDPPADPRSATAQARPYASCTLAHTELFDGQWSAKVLSEGAVKLRPFDEDNRDVPFGTDSRTGQPDFSPFSFHVSVDVATNDLRLEIAHRGPNNMLVWPGFEVPGAGTGLRALDGPPRRVRLDRQGTRDRFVGFGFGSGWESGSAAGDSLAVIAARDESGQLIPALTTGPPPPVTYRATAISRFAGGPMVGFLQLEMWFVSLSMQAMGLTPGIRTVFAPTPRIHPTPPPTIALEFTLQGLTEAQKVQVERFFQQHHFPTVDIQVEVPGNTSRILTLVDELTLPWSAVASARTDLAFDRAPFAVQDKLAAFLVTPTPSGAATDMPTASLSLLTHPLIGELRRTLGAAGVDGLLAGPPPDERRIGTPTAYTTAHVPTVPSDLLDFGVGGAFSSYHWELFVHLPLLISKRLTRDRRFDEAQRWLHFIFDPTAASKEGRDRGEPWQVQPFLRESMEAAAGELAVLLRGEATSSDARSYDEIRRDVDYLLGQIHDHPFDPHVVARLRTSAYKKAVVMAYLDNLIAWADHLFTLDTLESINEAAQLYVLAADVLGERPAQKPARAAFDKTFVELDGSPPTVPTIVPPPAAELLARGELPEEPPALTLELGFCVPANPKLLGYWDVVADRLYKVRHCQNIEGIERALALFAPPIDPGALVRAAAAGTGGGAALRGVPIRTPHYRYRVLHEHAVAAANNLRRFGGTFTNALVARDREALAELLAGQEVAMTEGTRSLLRLQRDDAESALKALEQTRRSVETAKDFVDGRQDETDLESAAFGLETAGVVIKTVSAALTQVAGFVGMTPQFTTGASGIASPVVTLEFGGDNIHKALDGVATGLATTADALSGMGGLVANRAELERRKATFAEDKRQAAIELARVLEEVEGARIRVAIASDNIATLEAQILNVRQVREQLRRRFTDEELWNWMVGRASEIYFQSYSVALDLARRAERAFQIELGVADSFVSAWNWDSLRKGLLSGEGLLLDLTRMNAAYLDRDRRAHELRLRIRLDELGGVAALRSAGKVELRIPERELDRRTPGHFRRRVKSVAVTVQGRNGPLDLPAKLTLLKGTTRVRPDLAEGYRRNERFEDERFVDEFGAASIVTSGRAEDTGLFARDYDDDRYLPFEGAGLADSLWELDLYADVGADLSAVADVELVIDYTAVDGGAALRQAAVAALR